MPEHRYSQYCALARTLDLAGDRWTLLIVRELAPGPRRFTDLIDGLPGVSRKLLTERLRALERDGIIGRREGIEESEELLGAALLGNTCWATMVTSAPGTPALRASSSDR